MPSTVRRRGLSYGSSSSSRLAVAALALELVQVVAQYSSSHTVIVVDAPPPPAIGAPPGMVDCGGHFESSCSMCPRNNGPEWCNGDCQWLRIAGSYEGGQCIPGPGHANEALWYGLSFLVSGLVMLCYACVYKQKVIVGPPPLPKVNTFISGPRLGIFDCFWYPDTCLYTLFCLPIVAAKNYYATEVCPFWPGCILTFLGTYSPFYCLTVFGRTVLSGRVQDKLGIKHNFCMDCVYAAFCFPCDVARESLEVDRELGVEITCCCQAKYTPRVVTEVANLVEKETRMCTKYRICGGSGH
mmetsp:Transcript_128676/g.320959  ORF Transcript_128676/g.320959 Transcript_128676/m.320959 type:complete len:298 (-) Transcript_128676:76-969(-)